MRGMRYSILVLSVLRVSSLPRLSFKFTWKVEQKNPSLGFSHIFHVAQQSLGGKHFNHNWLKIRLLRCFPHVPRIPQGKDSKPKNFPEKGCVCCCNLRLKLGLFLSV